MAILNVLNPYVDGQTIRDNAIDRSKLKSELKGAIEQIDGARVGGDKTGNTRGDSALDIQSLRSLETDVASGDSSIAIGLEAEASGNSSVSMGFGTTASNVNAIAIGRSCRAFGQNSIAIGNSNSARNAPDGQPNPGASGAIAIGANNSLVGNADEDGEVLGLGYSNTVTGDRSSAIGVNNTVSADDAHAYGKNVFVGAQDSLEIGLWSSAGSVSRISSIKFNLGGKISFTCIDSSEAPTDQSAEGQENELELGRDMFTIQRNGDAFTLYFNDAGTIKSLSLGTVS